MNASNPETIYSTGSGIEPRPGW